jgi:hypothetical protein
VQRQNAIPYEESKRVENERRGVIIRRWSACLMQLHVIGAVQVRLRILITWIRDSVDATVLESPRRPGCVVNRAGFSRRMLIAD